MSPLNRIRLLFFGVPSLFLAGCGGPAPPKTMSKDFDNLSRIQAAYLDYLIKNRKPPSSELDLRPFFEKGANSDMPLTSPEDGEPYVVIWGVDFRAVPIKRMPPPIIAYQSRGSSGRRHVLTVMGVQPMTDDEFANADFIGPKPK